MMPDPGSPVLAPNLYANGGSANYIYTGDVLRGIEKPYGFDPFGVSFSAGYRFVPWMSVGGFFDYASFQAYDGTDTGDYSDSTANLERQVYQIGAYARFYGVARHGDAGFGYFDIPIFDRLSPWLELGLAYAGDTSSYTRNQAQATGPVSGPLLQTYYITYQGLAANVRLGLDVRLAPLFSIGPVIGYGWTFPFGGCVDAEISQDTMGGGTVTNQPANTCAPKSATNVQGQGSPQTSGYGTLFGGIFVKVTLGPDATY